MYAKRIFTTLAGGKKVIVNALLVDNVSSASETFYTRYNALSTRADVIIYNGHAGLGSNAAVTDGTSNTLMTASVVLMADNGGH